MKVETVSFMGSDEDVVNAARVSFDKSIKKMSDKDKRLIKYLAKHNHWTPFGHCVAKFRVSVPIFVARQWFKHTVGFVYNEVSRRYVDSDPEIYVPNVWRKRPPSNIKQGSSNETMKVNKEVYEHLDTSLRIYKELIDSGVAPELARCILPQGAMTSFIVTGSLAAWARFYKLRSEETAQEEIQTCARNIGNYMNKAFPVSWKALTGEN